MFRVNEQAEKHNRAKLACENFALPNQTAIAVTGKYRVITVKFFI